jgi:predicted  nucleic acid-binding Zn-ribbon protein
MLFEARLVELQKNSNSQDCQVSELTARLTAEIDRARKAEADLREALEEAARRKEANQDLKDKLASMVEGSRGMQHDLDRLEGSVHFTSCLCGGFMW